MDQGTRFKTQNHLLQPTRSEVEGQVEEVTFSDTILSSLSSLLAESWAAPPSSSPSSHHPPHPLGQGSANRDLKDDQPWSLLFELGETLALDEMRGEIVDLHAADSTLVFLGPNHMMRREKGYLIPAAYPPVGSRSFWGRPVSSKGLKGADAQRHSEGTTRVWLKR